MWIDGQQAPIRTSNADLSMIIGTTNGLYADVNYLRGKRNSALLAQIGPFVSNKECPLPSRAGVTLYVLRLFSWSKHTIPPVKWENEESLITSITKFFSPFQSRRVTYTYLLSYWWCFLNSLWHLSVSQRHRNHHWIWYRGLLFLEDSHQRTRGEYVPIGLSWLRIGGLTSNALVPLQRN